MENGSIIEYPLANFQFLSVCHYITGFAFFLFNRHYLILAKQNQTVPVLNALFEYLSDSKNESEAKLELLQEILKGTDLYGGGENETLDTRYVKETYQHIISNALFFQNGSIPGYLAGIINGTDNPNYFALRHKVLRHLSENYTTRDYCSPGDKKFKLTKLATKIIFDDFVWSIFPEPNQDMSIIDVNYLYAIVGLKIITTTTDVTNLPFDDYIQIAREIDSQSFDNKTYRLILELFSVPALFFSACNDRKTFIEKYRFPPTKEFWTQAYNNLFSYINSETQKLVLQGLEKNLHFKLQEEIQNLQSRTFIANSILKVYCRYGAYEKVPEFYIGLYKTMYHWITKLILPGRCQTDDLPDLEDVYNDQFTDVEKTYNEIEKNTIWKVLSDGDLLKTINSNVRVEYARIENYRFDGFNPPKTHKANKNIYLLFAIVENKKPDFYALRQEKNALTLLTNRGNEPEFSKAVAGDPTLRMEVAEFATPLKFRRENSSVFIQRVADVKTKQFMKPLINHYRDPTLGEEMLEVIKSFVPFYSCVESIQADDKLGAAISCSLDVLSFIPFAGFAAKYSRIFTNSLAREIFHNTLLTSVISKVRNVGVISVQFLLPEILRVASRTISNEITIKGLLTDLLSASLRTVDPGFESIYQIGIFSICALEEIFPLLYSGLRKTPWTRNLINLLESILNSRQSGDLVADHTGLVPFVLRRGNNFEIVRYFYPGGSHFFGPTCVSSSGKIGELRSIEGQPLDLSMKPVKSGDVVTYKEYDPVNDKLGDFEFDMGKGDILRRLGYLLDLIAPQYDVNFVRNYHLYPLSIWWRKKSTRTNPAGNLPQSANPDPPSVSRITSIQSLPSVGDPSDPGISRSASRQSLHRFYKSDVSGNSRSASELHIPPFSDSDISTAGTASGGSKLVQVVDPKLPETPKEAAGLSPDVPGTSKGAIKKIPVAPASGDAARKPMKQEHSSKLDEYVALIPQKPQNLLKPEDYIAEFGQTEYDECVSLLKKFIDDGLSSIRQNNQQFRKLRLALDRITFMQMEEAVIKAPINLFHTTVIKRQKLINNLKNFKDKEFFFNDLIPLTKNPPNIPAINEDDLFTTSTTVTYQLRIDNQYGLVDLTHFHEMFQNQYILYPDVFFIVTKVKQSRHLLTLKLKKIELLRSEWTKIRNSELKTLMVNVLENSKRLQSIEDAAEFLSRNVPLREFEKTKIFFKQYILKTESSDSWVPTYDKLARDIYDNLRIPEIYNNWKINNAEFIDDVLFARQLPIVSDSLSASQRIHKIFGAILGERVKGVFDFYETSLAVRNSLRFEDFYVIHSRLKGKVILNRDNNRRFLASLYRLALRQCTEDWITDSITIFSSKMYSTNLCDKLRNYLSKDTFSFDNVGKFSSSREFEVENIVDSLKRGLKENPVLFQVSVRIQAGIPDFGRLVSVPNGIHFVFPIMKFVVDGVDEEIINGIKVLVVKLHDAEFPKENRMVHMARELNALFKTETVFYIKGT